MLLLAAFSPILLLVLALLVFRKPLIIVAPAVYGWTALIAVAVWSLPTEYLISGVLKGSFIALEIIIIVLGAIWFVSFLRHTRAIQAIEAELSRLSPDRRIQAIVITWLFGSFIEGSAGFGTPAAIVAPLMVAIGFPALLTVTVALVANSTAVTFGAVGTPITIGLAELDTEGVGILAANINFFAGLLVPVMVLALVVCSRADKRLRSFFECLPWTLFAGLAFVTPYAVLARLGNEFPSLVGGAMGLIIVAITVRYGFLVPRHCWRFESDGAFEAEHTSSKSLRAVTPYAIMLGLLFVGRYIFGGLQLDFYLPGAVPHSLRVFNPGFAFITALLVLSAFSPATLPALGSSLNVALKALFKPFVSILFITALVQTMLLSAMSPVSDAGMLETIVSSFKTEHLPWLSATIGAFGSFLAGSATVSNLLFGPIQEAMARELSLEITLVLALQLVGAGIGNMIALSNILAVQATVGLSGHEGKILARTILPCLLYLFLATFVAMLLIAYY